MSRSLSHPGRHGPIEGIGAGLRARHYREILETRPALPWFEVLVDNYLHGAGPPLDTLSRIAEHYPLVFHGVGLSIGSTDPLDREYLRKLKALKERFNPGWCSDHLCWTSVGGTHAHDLLPLPFTEEALKHLIGRIAQVQDFLGEQILVENVSSYLVFEGEMDEAEFVRAVAQGADCLLLLDVNNVHVNAINHGFNASDYLARIPTDRVAQIHLAGFDDRGDHLLDTHAKSVASPVWDLYREAFHHFGPVPACVEWDKSVPPLEGLLGEVEQARTICAEEFSDRAAG